MKGLFITFEGTDGSGKTTQMNLLAQRLRQEGRTVLLSREPGGCPISEKIRAILLDRDNAEMDAVTEAYLYAAARAQHVRQVIRPALARGEVVLCDRFLDSSLAYQAYGRGMGEDLVRAINAPAVDGLVPDLTVYLALDAEASVQRSRSRGEQPDRLEMAGVSLQEKVARAYALLAHREPERLVMIDAAQPIAHTQERIWKQVAARIL
ncbi:MAG: dTMP kinase [Eubacteriales bacterium]|nr:dTMP kinase [Eubacteriales bacterium]